MGWARETLSPEGTGRPVAAASHRAVAYALLPFSHVQENLVNSLLSY